MKTSPTTWHRPLLLTLLLATAAPAQAQDTPPVMFDGLAGSMAMNKLLFDNTTGRVAGSRGATKSFAYVPSAALKQKTVQGYVDRLKAKNPTAAQAVATTFGTGKYDYGTVYRGLIDGYNLRENDAVDAMTAYLVLGWMIVNNVQNDKAVTAAMVQGARTQVAPLLASNAKLAAPGVAAQVGEEMKLQSVIAQGGWQSAVKQGTLPAYRQGTASLFKTQYGLDLSQLKLTPQGFAAKNASATASKPATSGTAAATAASASAAAVTPAAASGSGLAAGAQWFFRSVSSGTGGISFEPVALLANGQYLDIGSEPLEVVNLTADKAKRPAAWGSWRKNGGTFVLTDYKGRPASYTLGSGSWFPAYPAGAVPLKRAYHNASGGAVGVATSLVISKIQFLDGTHFQDGKDAGIISSNAAGGSKRSGSGTYRLQGHTLTLTYADGRTVRKSFALGAEGTPARASNKIIFIGGDAYTEE
jgi:hypothetical protein